MSVSYDWLEQLWQSAGGQASDAAQAAAIAMAESGGNPNATNFNCKDGSHSASTAAGCSPYGGVSSEDEGLWQINTGNGPGPWFDPLTNAKEAVYLAYNTPNGWKNWTTYNTGAYKQFDNGLAGNIGTGQTAGIGSGINVTNGPGSIVGNLIAIAVVIGLVLVGAAILLGQAQQSSGTQIVPVPV